MKKLFFLFTIGLLININVKAQVSSAKTYKVEADVNVWNAILDCLDKSTAAHVDVKNLQTFIATQIQAQITADQKKTTSPRSKTDSLPVTKTKPSEIKKSTK